MDMGFKDLINKIKPFKKKEKEILELIYKYVDEKKFELIKKLLRDDKISIEMVRLNTNIVEPVDVPQIRALGKVDASDVNNLIKRKAREHIFEEFKNNAFEAIPGLIASNIVGLEEVKKAVTLQLFSKQVVHILLLGDPGTGKCVSYNSEILFSDGDIHPIGDFVESFLFQYDGESSMNKKIPLQSLNESLNIENNNSLKLWKKKSPNYLYSIGTESGEKIDVTSTHPFLTIKDGKIQWIEAKDIKKGDFLAKPRILKINGKSQKLENSIESSSNAIKLDIPNKTNKELMKLIGYLISEGNLNKNKSSTAIRFYSNDEEIKNDYKNNLKKIFSNLKTNEYIYDKLAVYTPSVELSRFLDSFDGKILGKSSERYLPSVCLKCTNSEVSSLLRTIFDSEAHFSKIRLNIELVSASEKFLRQIQYLLLRFGITSNIHPRKGRATNVKKPKYRTYYRLMIYGKSNFKKFKKNMGLICKRKKESLNYLVNRKYKENTNRDVIPNISKLLLETRKGLDLFQRECGFKGRLQKYENGTRNISRSRLKKVVKVFNLKFKNSKSNDRILKHNIDLLELLSKSDIYWTKIVKKEKIKSRNKWVYDITIPKNRNFICNNLIIHNTDIIRSASELHPISSFGLGSGTSGAGLIVTVKGNQIIPGLIPKANNGICCIDELNLMKEESRAGLYNAMEKGFVTYDKGGHHHKFDAKVKILATANPKGDQFEGNDIEELKKQLPFDPALLSRFHIVFLIRKPDIKKFKEIASNIIGEKKSKFNEADIDFVKDYLEYSNDAIKNVEFSKVNQRRVVDFVSELKKKEGKYLVEITPRIVIGIMRLCKALAKLELRYEVEKDDIDRIKDIIIASLNI